MTVPNGEAGINLPDFGVTDNGSIPGLPSRTQANAENFYKGMVQDSPSWGASSPIFGAVVNALIAGVFHLVADRVGTIPLVGGALEQVIDGFADWLFQTEGTANTAQVTATSKSKVTRATSAPSTPATNDVWIDTTATDGYVLYKVWNGTSWVVTTEKIAAEVADLIATGDDIQAFTANGTWTKPSGAKRAVVYLVGGSSGGGRGTAGNYNNVNSRGGGGGPGGWQRGYEFQASDLTGTVSVTIGSAGVGATSDNTAGTAGGTTSFGSYLSAGGGTCGGNDATGPVGAGVESGLLVNYGGIGGNQNVATAGGAGPFSAGGAAGSGTGGGAGSAGSAPPGALLFGPGSGGGGGAGKSGTGNGGNGGNGGTPGGPGGGGGAFQSFGTNGNGGAGALGKCWVITKFV